MYLAHWGLERSPFSSVPNPGDYYASPTHEEAFARLHFLVEHQRRLGLLLGAPGVGKSLQLELFAQQLRRRGFPVVKFSLFGLDSYEFVWKVATGLGITPAAQESWAGLWRSVADRLAAHRYQQLPTIVLLDDADDAETEVLTAVSRLLQLDQPETPLTMVLACQAQRHQLIGARLLELTELRIELEPWDLEDTTAYVQQVLRRAGRQETLFEPAALQQLQQRAAGIPRRVNQLAELCLLAGAVDQSRRIAPDVVTAVCFDLTHVPAQPEPV